MLSDFHTHLYIDFLMVPPSNQWNLRKYCNQSSRHKSSNAWSLHAWILVPLLKRLPRKTAWSERSPTSRQCDGRS